MAIKQPLVLLVDDEEDLCLLMQMTLARMGIKTHLAYRVEQAKKFFTEFQYDACLTDLNLPDGNGLDLVKHVTHNYPNTPIAVLTAYGNMDIAIAALKAGAFDFVSKPVNQTHLDQLIQKALNRPRPEQEAAETALENNYTTIIIADHGNCETMINPDGSPNTAHTTNPVPIILVDKDLKTIHDGVLGDIAPTILDLMGIEKPAVMTCKSLL